MCNLSNFIAFKLPIDWNEAFSKNVFAKWCSILGGSTGRDSSIFCSLYDRGKEQWEEHWGRKVSGGGGQEHGWTYVEEGKEKGRGLLTSLGISMTWMALDPIISLVSVPTGAGDRHDERQQRGHLKHRGWLEWTTWSKMENWSWKVAFPMSEEEMMIDWEWNRIMCSLHSEQWVTSVRRKLDSFF